MTSARKNVLKNIIIAEQMKKELEKRKKCVIKEKLKYLLEENPNDILLYLNSEEIEILIEEINRLNKTGCMKTEREKDSRITVINFGKKLLCNQTFDNKENKMVMIPKELLNIALSMQLPLEKINVEELFVEKKPYSLKEFLRDSTKPAVPGMIPVEIVQAKRPRVICNDGFSLSIQASNAHYSEPNENAKSDYKAFELGYLSQREEELNQYIEMWCNEEEYEKAVYAYVPKKVVESLLEKHGGIDRERTFNNRRFDEEIEK